MGKKKIIKTYYLLVAILLLTTLNINAQKMEIDRMFNNKENILKWCDEYNIFIIDTLDVSIEGSNFFILVGDNCFGVVCYAIYIFSWDNGIWQIKTIKSIDIKKVIEISVEKEEKSYREEENCVELKKKLRINIDYETEKIMIKMGTNKTLIEILFEEIILN